MGRSMVKFDRFTSMRALAIAAGLGLSLSMAGCMGADLGGLSNIGGLNTNAGGGPRGWVLDEKALAQIQPGSSAEQVVLVLGTPSTTSTVGGKTYYYISQNVSQTFLFQAETITDQRVVAVSLDDKNKVSKVANYGMKDGVVFDFITRTTPAGGAEASFAGNILRRLGQSAV